MMTERELAALIDQAERDSVTESGDFNSYNETLFQYYQSEPFGDEIEGQSQVVTSDVADIVESDMPSLVRVFLSGNTVAEFTPLTGKDIQEVEEKNIYIPHVINNSKDFYRKFHGLLKQLEIQLLGILEYGIRDDRRVSTITREVGSIEELAKLKEKIEGEPDVSRVDITAAGEEGGESLEIEVRITKGSQDFFIENIANEDIILSRNAESKDDADIVGKRFRKSRGDLIAEGFNEDLIRSLPASTPDENSSAKQERYKRQGGDTEESDSIDHWVNELVQGVDVYAKVDFDEDGIPERRHVIKVGSEVLVNEPFDHVPYAIGSALLMPMNMVGKSRGEQGKTTQRVQSVLTRNMLDNIYSVNNPGHVVNDDVVEIDDMLTQRPNRIVRANGAIAGNILPLETPYIGDKALQVIQYMDSLQTRRTGTHLSSQGLDADVLHKETATRFEGVERAGQAKIELVVRNVAETIVRDLYEGAEWYLREYQDEPQQIYVGGRTVTVDPSQWQYDHPVTVVVGTGAGDNEKTLETLASIYNLQLQQKQIGSTLADDKKIYNTLEKIIKASGLHKPDRYFNDPERPDQVLFAENQLLKQQLKQVMAQLEDPLSKAEKVKQQGSIARDQMKYQFEKQMKAVEVAQENKDRETDVFLKVAEMELEHNTDISGAGLNEQ